MAVGFQIGTPTHTSPPPGYIPSVGLCELVGGKLVVGEYVVGDGVGEVVVGASLGTGEIVGLGVATMVGSAVGPGTGSMVGAGVIVGEVVVGASLGAGEIVGEGVGNAVPGYQAGAGAQSGMGAPAKT